MILQDLPITWGVIGFIAGCCFGASGMILVLAFTLRNGRHVRRTEDGSYEWYVPSGHLGE